MIYCFLHIIDSGRSLVLHIKEKGHHPARRYFFVPSLLRGQHIGHIIFLYKILRKIIGLYKRIILKNKKNKQEHHKRLKLTRNGDAD